MPRNHKLQNAEEISVSNYTFSSSKFVRLKQERLSINVLQVHQNL